MAREREWKGRKKEIVSMHQSMEKINALAYIMHTLDTSVGN